MVALLILRRASLRNPAFRSPPLGEEGGRGRLAVTIGPPARDGPVTHHPTVVEGAGCQLRERARWRHRLALDITPPARHRLVAADPAGVQAPGGELREYPTGRRCLAGPVVPPARGRPVAPQ